MLAAFNPNSNITSLPRNNMSDIKNQYGREPSEVLSVEPRVYKMGENVGATYRFDLKDANGNYCGVTAESVQQLTDEHLSVSEGIKRLMLAHASGKPWWVSIGNHRPHTTFRVPQGFYGTELYPNGTGDVVKPAVHPEAPIGAPFMSGNWQVLTHTPAHQCAAGKAPVVSLRPG